MHVSSWMTLRLEQSVKVPERTFYISIGWHLSESHLQENLLELFAYLHQRVTMSSSLYRTICIEIVLFVSALALPLLCYLQCISHLLLAHFHELMYLKSGKCDSVPTKC